MHAYMNIYDWIFTGFLKVLLTPLPLEPFNVIQNVNYTA